ncbi:MAG TPA: polysaccharide deacetylase family protein [Solirubrobacteraceae bacterium]|nr:polysaccharide deacetylase family protein [Solirubrobacteraceae bacterium]
MDAGARRTRREESRRAVRRRRLIALGVIGVLAAGGAAIALAAGGSSSQAGHGQASGPAAGAGQPQGAEGSGEAAGPSTASLGHGPPGEEPVPILMYHVIASPPAGAPFPGLYVPPEEFAAQMQALKEAGWHAVTLDRVEAYWRSGVPLGPGKPIVLSFDNGYNSQYTQALPVLQRLGWVGVENLQLSGLPPSQGGLGEGQVRGLLAAGWELDTQGFSHADLVTLDSEELHYQVAGARTALQRRYGVAVNWFCYPSGHYDATVIAAVKAAGYTGSTTVIPGWAHPSEDPYRLHRLRVLGGTSPQALLSLLQGIREEPPAPASYGT